jgi:hypothetical protein
MGIIEAIDGLRIADRVELESLIRGFRAIKSSNCPPVDWSGHVPQDANDECQYVDIMEWLLVKLVDGNFEEDIRWWTGIRE